MTGHCTVSCSNPHQSTECPACQGSWNLGLPRRSVANTTFPRWEDRRKHCVITEAFHTLHCAGVAFETMSRAKISVFYHRSLD